MVYSFRVNWSERPIAERVAIRREMSRQAMLATAGLFASVAQQKASVRIMVDSALAKERMASQRQQLVDQPDAENDDNADLGDFGEGFRQGNEGENPPDQPKDQTHDKNSNEQRNHEAPQLVGCKGERHGN